MFKKKEIKRKKDPEVTLSEGRLTVDCKGCGGSSSVEDRGCLLCLCKSVRDKSDLSLITMKSSSDVAIQGEAVSVIRELSFLYDLLSSSCSERKGRKCKHCKRSFLVLVKDQLEEFPDVNISILRDRMSQMQFPDSVCSLCAADSLKLIETIEDSLSNIGLDIAVIDVEGE